MQKVSETDRKAAIQVGAALADKEYQSPKIQCLMFEYARRLTDGEDAYNVLTIRKDDSAEEKAAKRLLGGLSGD